MLMGSHALDWSSSLVAESVQRLEAAPAHGPNLNPDAARCQGFFMPAGFVQVSDCA